MEFLNRIELKGVVGRADVNSYNGNQVCNFSVVTENTAVDREGKSIIEPHWFNVTAWSGVKGLSDFSLLQKGCWVHVIGRLHMRKYTTQDNEERTAIEVPARLVEILDKEDQHMQPQRDY